MERAVIHISGNVFAFPAYSTLAPTVIQELMEYLIHQHGIPYNTVLDQRSHFPEKEVQQWAYNHVKPCSFHNLCHPEPTGLREW